MSLESLALLAALLVVAATFVFIFMNKAFNLAQQRLDLEKLDADRRHQVNKGAAEAALLAALDEKLKPFDKRINDTWATVSTTREELNALRLQVGIKGVIK